MRAHTTFRIGGPADLYVRPRTLEALAMTIRTLKAASIPIFLFGGGANILVGDKGIRGAVIDTGLLSSVSAKALPDGHTCLSAECGVQVSTLCEEALIRGLSGLENFYGMPGSVGGAIYMNARCYEDDISQHIQEIEYIKGGDSPQEVSGLCRVVVNTLPWAYKHSPFMAGEPLANAIVGAADFLLFPDAPQSIAPRMRERLANRLHKHHFDYPSAGSTFKNNRNFGKPTGKILDELGLRGYRVGDAAISPWHANIFVNLGNATALDMRTLIEHAQSVALATMGLHLELEILFVGEF